MNGRRPAQPEFSIVRSVPRGKWLPYIEAVKRLAAGHWLRIYYTEQTDYERVRTGLYHAARSRGLRVSVCLHESSVYVRVQPTEAN